MKKFYSKKHTAKFFLVKAPVKFLLGKIFVKCKNSKSVVLTVKDCESKRDTSRLPNYAGVKVN